MTVIAKLVSGHSDLIVRIVYIVDQALARFPAVIAMVLHIHVLDSLNAKFIARSGQ